MGKILITGAAGFIGSHLVDLLIKKGVKKSELRLFVKGAESVVNITHDGLEIVRGNIKDKRAIKTAMKGVSVVYHLAAKIDFDGPSYKAYYNTNVKGTQNLLEQCKGKKIQKFVFFSSIGVYGLPADVGDILGIDETHPHTYSNFYGQSKAEAEDAVVAAHKAWGLPYTIIRPASVYGPREKGPTLALYRSIHKNQFLVVGNGKNKMHYVYVKDLVEGARQAQLSKKAASDYILAGARPVSLNTLVHEMGASIGKRIPNIKIPKLLALIASYPVEAISGIVGFDSPIFPSRVKTMTASYYYSIAKARKEINYTPSINIHEGAKITGEWYKKNKYL